LSRDGGDVHLLLDGRYHDRPGRLTALTSTKDGVAWALTAAPNRTKVNVIRWTDHGWKEIGRVP